MQGRVLICAGSDSGGGAGIQADIKTTTVLGGFAMTAITALTAQNTIGVQNIFPIPTHFVIEQMVSTLSDIGADVIKTGMLGSPDIVRAIVDTVEAYAPNAKLVVDPVMRAKGGAVLIDDATTEVMRTVLVRRALIVTPNIPEAEVLSGLSITSEDDMRRAADAILLAGPQAVLIKGGHMSGHTLLDVLRNRNGQEWTFAAKRVDTIHTHGTGCAMAAAISTGLAQGLALSKAVGRAQAFVQQAIISAPGFGRGHGPLNYSCDLKSYL